MAIIPQISFDEWDDDNELGDLERLRLVIEHMPDEKLMRQLEKERYKGRDKYPVRMVWNSILAGVVFGHSSMEDLIRELKRNSQLRKMC
jgi:transposase